MIVGTDVVSTAVSIVLKVTVIVAAGLAGAWLARGSRAAVRHAVLAASFVVMLGLPIGSMIVPPVPVTVTVAPTVFVNTIDAVPQVASSSVRVVEVPSVSRWTWPSAGTLLLAGWFAGALFFLLRMMVGLRQVHLLRRFGLPWRGGQGVVDRLALDAGIRRRVDVLVHESLPAPVTCGVAHPAIVLPPDAQSWAAPDLNRALVHELEYVRRGDWVVHCVARVVCAVYWFHPLVWMAWRWLALEAERACDDAVLSGSEATLYADQLVGLAHRLSTNRKSPALAMANRSDLSARVGAVLDSRQRRGRVGKMLVASVCAVAAAAVVMMSPLTMAADASAFEVASVKPNNSGATRAPSAILPGGRFTATNNTVRALILNAYDIAASPSLLSAGPGWIDSEAYDIDARAEANAIPANVTGKPLWDKTRLMLRTLLADRFKLSMHRDTKEMSIYELVVAKNGPKLKSVSPDCAANISACHSFSGNPRRLTGTGIDMSDLAEELTFPGDRIVRDKTGISGLFDVVLQWNPFAGRPVAPVASDDAPRAPEAAGREGPFPDIASLPNIFDALEQQAGLKLQAAKRPVEVYVIDHVERPSEN